MLSLPNCASIETTTAMCDCLDFDVIIPFELYKSMQKNKDFAAIEIERSCSNLENGKSQRENDSLSPDIKTETESAAKDVCLVSPPPDFDVLQKRDERKNISDLPAREENEKELFFINVCDAVENSEYDSSHVTDLLIILMTC